MADKYLIEPDAEFIRTVIEMGGDSLKKCFQCAACSTACTLAPDDRPFPRKEMMWAQWGLKDRLVNDPDVWLCHQCNDCSVNCPRGAKPGDVLAAVRNYIYSTCAFPKFMGKALGNARCLPLLFAAPVILFIAILSGIGNLSFPPGEIIFAKFLPHLYVDSVFMTIGLWIFISFGISVSRFWKNIRANDADRGRRKNGPLLKSIIAAAVEILTHKKFKECGSDKIRYSGHLAVFYGFIGLFITTTIVFFGTCILENIFGLNILTPPLSLLNPVKIFANLSAISLFTGCTIAIINRVVNKEKAGGNNYYDWIFLIVLYAVTITGILTELSRLADMAALAYSLYFIHLVLIFFLLAYFPYSKFAHIVYRFVAIVYSIKTGGDKKNMPKAV